MPQLFIIHYSLLILVTDGFCSLLIAAILPLLLFCLTHLFVLFIMFKHLYIFIYAQIYEIKVLERRKCYETNLPTQEKTKKQSPRIP